MPIGRRPLGAVLAAACVAATLLGATGTASAAEEPITTAMVVIDQATLMRIDGVARSIIVGNPAIADATILDASTIIITGKSFGTTNLIILDGVGGIITNQLLTVQSNTTQLTLFRRSSRETFSCTPVCVPVLTVGDAAGAFTTTTQQVETRNGLAAAE